MTTAITFTIGGE